MVKADQCIDCECMKNGIYLKKTQNAEQKLKML